MKQQIGLQEEGVMKKRDNRIQFINHANSNIEIRYYDDPTYPFCLNWKMPRYIVAELSMWWKKVNKKRTKSFPINEKRQRCEFAMQTDRYVDIKEFDSLGRYKVIGWSLPRIIVDELVIWQRGIDKYEDTSHK